jgi:hypothetical protein
MVGVTCQFLQAYGLVNGAPTPGYGLVNGAPTPVNLAYGLVNGAPTPVGLEVNQGKAIRKSIQLV